MLENNSQPLSQLFNSSSFAWQLLEWQIAIQMNQDLQGQAIARLLQLYMKGVEVMNSCMDIRESYFKNKVTSLMMKNNVIKTLNKPPMAKKEKPLQATAKKEHHKDKKHHRHQKKQKPTVSTVQHSSPTIQKITAQSCALKEKKRQMEMRLTYETSENANQKLSELMSLHNKKEQFFKRKVNGLMNEHEQRLKQRLQRRHLKTVTSRSRIDATNDTSCKIVEQLVHKKNQDETFDFNMQQKQGKKRCKSVEIKKQFSLDFVPERKTRKYTLDFNKIEQLLPKTEIKKENIENKQNY